MTFKLNGSGTEAETREERESVAEGLSHGECAGDGGTSSLISPFPPPSTWEWYRKPLHFPSPP